MSMRDTYLVFFPAHPAPVGIVPAHYLETSSATQRDEMLADGGRDVTESHDHWSAYGRDLYQLGEMSVI